MAKSNFRYFGPLAAGALLVPALLSGLLTACGGGTSPSEPASPVAIQACVSQPSVVKTRQCPSPQTGTMSYQTETASCKVATYGAEISTDTSACVTPKLVVAIELAQTHVIPAKGLSWYKKISATDASGKPTAYTWIKVSEGLRWAPDAADPAADWTKTKVTPGTEVPADYVLDATLRINSNRNALVLVDVGSSTVRPKNPKLQIWRNGTLAKELALNPPEQLDGTESNGPAYAKNSYSVMLDAQYVKPGSTLRVASDDYGTSDEVVPAFGADAEMDMWILPFYLFGADETNTKPLRDIALPQAGWMSELTQVWPFARLDFKSHAIAKIVWPYLVIGPRSGNAAYQMRTVVPTSAFDHYSSMLQILQLLRIADGLANVNAQYYSPFFTIDKNGNDSSQVGNGLGGGNGGVGDYLYQAAFYHEQGHAFGLSHAGTEYPMSFPYLKGSLKESAWGYDLRLRKFLPPFIPADSKSFASCKNRAYQLLNAAGQCAKQDPMQSGQTDGPSTARYSMMSDYNIARIQRWLEGSTSAGANGVHTYASQKIMTDANALTGYSRWDGIDKKRVDFQSTTESKALFEINQNFPVKKNIPVQTIVLTHSIAGAQIANQAYPYPIDPQLSQIYPLIPTHTGNLISYIDPSDRSAEKVGEYNPNNTAGKYASFCKNSGCDFTLRVSYSNGDVEHVLLQGLTSARRWLSADGPWQSFTPDQADSFETAVVNVSVESGRTAIRAELLFTPTPWLSWPNSPLVIAARDF